MFSLVSTLILVPIFMFVLLLLLLGVPLLRMLMGVKPRRKPVTTAHRADKPNDERRQRIKSQFKQDGEYVDFEEVPDIMTDKS
ncbi:MAG: hypothetical protein ACI392_01070 [Paludibacteraceae bacterium]